MRAVGRLAVSAILAVASIVAVAPAHATDVSHRIDATAEGSFDTTHGNYIGPGLVLDSSDQVLLQATVRNGAWIKGPLSATLSVIGGTPRTYVVGWVSVGRDRRAIGLDVHGFFNTETGETTLDGVVLSPTGTTGALHFHGVAINGGAIAFDEISGTIVRSVP